jgi:hypothetical protein
MTTLLLKLLIFLAFPIAPLIRMLSDAAGGWMQTRAIQNDSAIAQTISLAHMDAQHCGVS